MLFFEKNTEHLLSCWPLPQLNGNLNISTGQRPDWKHVPLHHVTPLRKGECVTTFAIRHDKQRIRYITYTIRPLGKRALKHDPSSSFHDP